VVNADGPVDDDILSRGPSASPPNSIAGLGPNQVGEIIKEDHRSQCCGAEAQSRGAEIKLPPGAGSFLFIKGLKKFYRKKSWLVKKFL
jgi:hypothetical protein